MFELPFLRIVVVDVVEQFLVKVAPLLKSKLLAEYARAHVVGDKRSLNKQGARSAHRIDEIALTVPARHEYHSGSKHLVERSLDRLLPVASAVQGFSA